jgi:hypothetical protein
MTMRPKRGNVVAAALLFLVAAVGIAAGQPVSAAGGTQFAPLDRPGPALSVPAKALRDSLQCNGRLGAGGHEPILLIPGTNLDPGSNFSWNYERAFSAKHWSWCAVTLPHHTMGDVQLAGEYVVHAIRVMAHRSERRVEILGFSQGGMLSRWSLRFWPDTRSLVDDVVGLDPSSHGTLDSEVLCQVACPPAYWQQAAGSQFDAALNSRTETFRGIDYTVAFSKTDEVVVPNFDASGSSSLHTGHGDIANIAVQDICPADLSEHLSMGSYDPVGYALAIDAFTHPGPAKASRVPASVCMQGVQPGVDPSTFPVDWAKYLAAVGANATQSPITASEPPLACYVYATPPTGCAKTSG